MSLLLFKTNRKCLNAASSLLKLVTWKFGSLVVGIAGHCPMAYSGYLSVAFGGSFFEVCPGRRPYKNKQQCTETETYFYAGLCVKCRVCGAV